MKETCLVYIGGIIIKLMLVLVKKYNRKLNWEPLHYKNQTSTRYVECTYVQINSSQLTPIDNEMIKENRF